MSAKLTPEQLDEIRDILKRDPPASITDDDFDTALEEVSAANPELATAWVLTFDEPVVDAPKEKLPAEVTAKRARRTAFFARTAQSATTSAVGEEDTPVSFLPDQRRIALLVAGLVLLVLLVGGVYFWVTSATRDLPTPVIEPVLEEPTEELPVIAAPPAPVIEVPPAPIVVEEPAAPSPAPVFTNQSPAPAPAPAPVSTPQGVAGGEMAAPLVLPISTYQDTMPGEAINAVLYREEPAQGMSTGLNPVFVHVSDVGAGAPINITGASQAGQGVASGLLPNNSTGAGNQAALMLYSDQPTGAEAGSTIVFSDSNSVVAGGETITYSLQEPASTPALEVYRNGGGASAASTVPPGGLVMEAYPVDSLAAGVSFDSPADALRAAGIPDDANAALQSNTPAADLIITPPSAGPIAGSPVSSEDSGGGSVDTRFAGPLPTTQAEFDAFLGDVPLSSDPAGGATVVSSTSTEFVVGERVPARLVTSATILDGVPAPVIAETFGTWCSIGPCPQVTFVGQASLMGPNRVVINFHTMITGDEARAFTGIALSEEYSTSIPATIRDETPALAPNLMRASLGGVSAYAQAMLNQTQTTFLPDGGTIEQTVMPSLEALIAGNMASALQLPQSTQTVVRLAELDPGLDIIVAVGLAY